MTESEPDATEEPIVESTTRPFAHYSGDLVEQMAESWNRYLTPKQKTLPAGERIEKGLQGKSLQKGIAALTQAERDALSIFLHTPRYEHRWDNGVRLLTAFGIESPYRVIQQLLALGLLELRPTKADSQVVRFEIADGLDPQALPGVRLTPTVAEQSVPSTLPAKPLAGSFSEKGWREVDGFDWPIRLAYLWRLAWNAPIKRTQQGTLFKRDHERVISSPLSNTPMMDQPIPIEQLGLLAFEIGIGLGWLTGNDELSPTQALPALLEGELTEFLLRVASAFFPVENWNELGAQFPPGMQRRESASARVFVVLLLATLGDQEGSPVSQIASRLGAVHPPFTGSEDSVGPLKFPENREKLCSEWTKRFVVGPLFQTGIVSLNLSDAADPLVRLSPLGRAWVGLAPAIIPTQPFPQTLLVQPNHEMIVYRQGLNLSLLARLFSFAEPKSIGAALQLELTADSVYHGLETGLTQNEMIDVLKSAGGREPPPGVLESIRTWTQKRSRLTVFGDASVYEFADEKDLQEAIQRGVVGTQITDRLLVVGADAERSFAPLRIAASRDYRFASEPCVDIGNDGVTLKIDRGKSDLMLESELRRFADPSEVTDAQNRQIYRVSPTSLARGMDQGLRTEELDEWFRHRTGKGVPASIQMLARAYEGLSVSLTRPIVLRTPTAEILDGLVQHSRTAELLGNRLGPTTVILDEANEEAFLEALRELGIEIQHDSSVKSSNDIERAETNI